jgi:hypothetical protein
VTVGELRDVLGAFPEGALVLVEAQEVETGFVAPAVESPERVVECRSEGHWDGDYRPVGLKWGPSVLAVVLYRAKGKS